MKKQTIIFAVLCFVLVFSVALNIILISMWPKEQAHSSDKQDTTEATVSTTITTQPIIEDTTLAPKTMTEISTPYGVIEFPEIYNDIQHEASEEYGVYSLEFSYLRNDEKVTVFTLHFGDKELGTWICDIEVDGEIIPFTVTSDESPFDNSWTDEEKEYFDAVMMSINDIINSVEKWDSYIE